MLVRLLNVRLGVKDIKITDYSLHVYFSHSELQVQSAVQRALRAEEELQAALGKIQDLERQLQSQSRAEPQPAQGSNTRNIVPKMENRGAGMSAELLSV